MSAFLVILIEDSISQPLRSTVADKPQYRFPGLRALLQFVKEAACGGVFYPFHPTQQVDGEAYKPGALKGMIWFALLASSVPQT